MIWLIALLLPVPAPLSSLATTDSEPRIEWVELQRAGQDTQALASVEQYLAYEHEGGADKGVLYLRGRLLTRLGERDRAAEVLLAGLATDAGLEPFARLRLAEVESARGRPEVAADLLAVLLAAKPPSQLRTPASRLLARAIRRGADCRLLEPLDGWSLDEESQRVLRLQRSDCHRLGAPARADADLIALLADDTADGVALEAAERLADSLTDPSGEISLDMAKAFFGQRDFPLALDYYSRALQPEAMPLAARADYETHYAVGRSYFWLGDYRRAAQRFASVVGLSSARDKKARAHYQEARSLELAGDTAAAELAFGRAFTSDPEGSWAAAALTSRMRLAWIDGRESEALKLYSGLANRRRWRGSRARAALFLAASDLVRDRSDRAGAWLDVVAGTPDPHLPELAYWQGRLAEIEGDTLRAQQRYRVALLDDLYDPWSQEAVKRLEQPALRLEAERAAAVLIASGRERDLLAAWLLTPESEPGRKAFSDLLTLLRSRPRERPFLDLAPVATAAWPLWSDPLNDPEERLLALGDWEFGLPAVSRHFPASELRLAITRARLLAEAGMTRASILTAELVGKQMPSTVPGPLWPAELTARLYPQAHGATIRRYAGAREFDPLLLTALIREESRFDASATSAAAARGLTQFVLPTARRLAQVIGIEELQASDLHDPEISIRLGAAYLEELAQRFVAREPQMLAAYNAGESQTDQWRRYCFSDEPAEFLTKIGFRETRSYVRKVLRARARYRELYGESPDPVETATGGSASSTASK